MYAIRSYYALLPSPFPPRNFLRALHRRIERERLKNRQRAPIGRGQTSRRLSSGLGMVDPCAERQQGGEDDSQTNIGGRDSYNFV